MKKSKIIIPALAMIAFSTAASISGAVAWFTASRQATIDAGTYAVVKTNADLGCTVATDIGTLAVTNPANNGIRTVSLTNGTQTNKLTDGSFNHDDKIITTPDTEGKTFAPSPKGQISLDDATDALLTRDTLTTGKIYTAVTWDVTFTVNFGAIAGNIGLFLDTAASNYTPGPVSGVTPEPSTARGFRMAFIPADTTNGVTKVYAPLQTTENCKYIASSSDTTLAGASYTGNALISSDTVTSLAQTANVLPEHEIDETVGAGRADYFGKFVYSEGNVVTLAYKVVCWFEGTDPEIRNRASADDYQSVITRLSFRALNLTNNG